MHKATVSSGIRKNFVERSIMRVLLTQRNSHEFHYGRLIIRLQFFEQGLALLAGIISAIAIAEM